MHEAANRSTSRSAFSLAGMITGASSGAGARQMRAGMPTRRPLTN